MAVKRTLRIIRTILFLLPLAGASLLSSCGADNHLKKGDQFSGVTARRRAPIPAMPSSESPLRIPLLVLRDGAVTSGGSHIDYGVGIRALEGDATGYAYSESTALPEMLGSARAASAIASGGQAPVSENGIII